MWIKICGNTNLEDAKLAAELGADAVGFVFAKSVRRVTPEQVSEIVPRLPDTVEKIGVFSSQKSEEIAEIVRRTGITGVQLHGGFDLNLARRLTTEFGDRVTIVQVLHWGVGRGAADAEGVTAHMKVLAAESAGARVLVDSMTKSGSGGTGQRFDWTEAHSALVGELDLKVIVAGGLDPDNVARAASQLRPWGVDVASGVEASKGHKDALKVRAFIQAARKF